MTKSQIVSASKLKTINSLFVQYEIPVIVEHAKNRAVDSLIVVSEDVCWSLWFDEDGWYSLSLDGQSSVLTLDYASLLSGKELAMLIASETYWKIRLDIRPENNLRPLAEAIKCGLELLINQVIARTRDVSTIKTTRQLLMMWADLGEIFDSKLTLHKTFENNNVMSGEFASLRQQEQPNDTNTSAKTQRVQNLFNRRVIWDLTGPLRHYDNIFLLFEVIDSNVSTIDFATGTETGLANKHNVELAQLGLGQISSQAMVDASVFPSRKLSPARRRAIQRFFSFDLVPNDFVLVGKDDRHVSFPDFLGSGEICLVRHFTLGMEFALKKYWNEIQWELHVSGATLCVFIVDNGELNWTFVERDESTIRVLARSAQNKLNAGIKGGASYFADHGYGSLEFRGKNTDDFFDKGASLLVRRIPERQASGRGSAKTAATRAPSTKKLKVESQIATSGKSVNASAEPRPKLTRQAGAQVHAASSWTNKKRRKLLKKYLKSSSDHPISLSNFDNVEIISELARILLRTKGELVDPTCPRFGRTWTQVEYAVVLKLWKRGHPLHRIAKSVERDQLGVAFVIFARHPPTVPKKIIKKYSL